MSTSQLLTISEDEYSALIRERDAARNEVEQLRAQLRASRESARNDDGAWISGLAASPAYLGIDVPREFAKLGVWCSAHGKQPTRRRFITWLNRIERPMVAASAHRDSAGEARLNAF